MSRVTQEMNFSMNIDIEPHVIEQIVNQIQNHDHNSVSENFKKIQLDIENFSQYPASHIMFDPYKVVDQYMTNAPRFQSMYKFTGLWKPCSNQPVV